MGLEAPGTPAYLPGVSFTPPSFLRIPGGQGPHVWRGGQLAGAQIVSAAPPSTMPTCDLDHRVGATQPLESLRGVLGCRNPAMRTLILNSAFAITFCWAVAVLLVRRWLAL